MTNTKPVPPHAAPRPDVLIVRLDVFGFHAGQYLALGTETAHAATWPRSTGMRASTLAGQGWRVGLVRGHAKLRADKVNAGVNETGKARARAILRHARRAGMTILVQPDARVHTPDGRPTAAPDPAALAAIEAQLAP